MNTITHRLALALGVLTLAASTGCASPNVYRQRNLVSDKPAIPAEHHDPQLVNSWGVAFNQFAVAWVADNGSGVSTLYDGDGNKQSLVVTVPGANGAAGNPTGIVFYGGSEFVVTQGKLSGPARFIFASEDGGISAWAPNVDPTSAIRVLSSAGAVYKGLALGAAGNGARLYATDFHNGKVDMFDGAFNPIFLAGRPFVDPGIPDGYAPFGIQAINGDIYVTYAKQDADRHDDVPGRGHGYISVFDSDGRFVRRLVSRGDLDSPWGLALAPASFGHLGNRLLVGNFGNGRINAYDPVTGEWAGQLHGEDDKPIRIDGLWGLAFGNGLRNQPTNTLFFASGPNGEQDGLYGRLDPIRRHDDGDK